MPREDLIQIRRGSRAAFNALTSGNKLEAGELGSATDTQELLVGLGPTVDPFVVGSGGGPSYLTRVDTGLDDIDNVTQTYAFIGGDQSGNARGQQALDVQSQRTAVTQVASGYGAICVGKQNTASGANAIAVGLSNSVVTGFVFGASNNVQSSNEGVVFGSNNVCPDRATVVGRSNTFTNGSLHVLVGDRVRLTASPGFAAVAVGYDVVASGDGVVAFGSALVVSGGYNPTIGFFNTNTGASTTAVGTGIENSGANSALFGGAVVNTIEGILELKQGSARLRGYSNTGMLALSVQNRATAYANTAADEGSEPENTLRPGMFAIRRNGLEFRLDYNDGGVVKSVSLGTVV